LKKVIKAETPKRTRAASTTALGSQNRALDPTNKPPAQIQQQLAEEIATHKSYLEKEKLKAKEK